MLPRCSFRKRTLYHIVHASNQSQGFSVWAQDENNIINVAFLLIHMNIEYCEWMWNQSTDFWYSKLVTIIATVSYYILWHSVACMAYVQVNLYSGSMSIKKHPTPWWGGGGLWAQTMADATIRNESDDESGFDILENLKIKLLIRLKLWKESFLYLCYIVAYGALCIQCFTVTFRICVERKLVFDEKHWKQMLFNINSKINFLLSINFFSYPWNCFCYPLDFWKPYHLPFNERMQYYRDEFDKLCSFFSICNSF